MRIQTPHMLGGTPNVVQDPFPSTGMPNLTNGLPHQVTTSQLGGIGGISPGPLGTHPNSTPTQTQMLAQTPQHPSLPGLLPPGHPTLGCSPLQWRSTWWLEPLSGLTGCNENEHRFGELHDKLYERKYTRSHEQFSWHDEQHCNWATRFNLSHKLHELASLDAWFIHTFSLPSHEPGRRNTDTFFIKLISSEPKGYPNHRCFPRCLCCGDPNRSRQDKFSIGLSGARGTRRKASQRMGIRPYVLFILAFCYKSG